MNILLNDLLLLFISVLFLIFEEIDVSTTTALLCAIILAATSYLYSDKRWTSLLRLCYLILTVWNRAFFYTLPLLFYNAPLWKQKELNIPCVLLYLLPMIFHLNFHYLGFDLLWLLAMLFSLLLKQQTLSQQQLEQDYKKQRDTSRELAMILSEKNKNLLIQQEQEVRIATLNERNHIAREIHDNVGHLLSSALLQIGAIQAIFTQEELQEPLTNLRSTISTSMDSIRSSVHNLHDDALDLQAALQTLIQNFTFCKGNFVYDVTHSMSQEMIYHILAIVKECMNNTMKHSNATVFTVTLREQPTFYQLILTDNGTSIKKQDTGIGLKNIRERVETMHGFLNIQTEQGFCLFITLPKEEIAHENINC